jgi:hypothetical protein
MPEGHVRRYGALTVALTTVALALMACDAATTTDAGDGAPASSAPTSAKASSTGEATSSSTPTSTPDPAPTVQPTPASSDAPAANLAVPTEPEETGEETREGFQAFTEHWLDLLSYSYEANDLAPLQAVSDPACQFCKDSEAAMAQIYQVGWAAGGATTLNDFTTEFAPDTAGTYTAEITTTQAEIFYFSGEGWLGSSESRPNTAHIITARYTDGQWQLIDYSTPASPTSEQPGG